MVKVKLEKYLKEKQYTLTALALFATLTFTLSNSSVNLDTIFALISGLITQFLLISLNSREVRNVTISLVAFRTLITLSAMTFPIYAMIRLPNFLNSPDLTIIFWTILLLLAIINQFKKTEL
ncbi:MAG: hypothetical protein AABX07_01255 [Nanoarchaeota archaeon]